MVYVKPILDKNTQPHVILSTVATGHVKEAVNFIPVMFPNVTMRHDNSILDWSTPSHSIPYLVFWQWKTSF